MTDLAAKRPRGRPKSAADGLSPSARSKAAREAQIAAGGALRQFMLSGAALAALAAIRARDGDKSDRAVIERLLLAGAE